MLSHFSQHIYTTYVCAREYQFLQFTYASSKDKDQSADVQTDQCLHWRMQKYWVLVGRAVN